MIADLHNHTRLSDDAPQDPTNTITERLKTANALGISYLAITEHADITTRSSSCYQVDFDAYQKVFSAAKEAALHENLNKTRLLFGAEIAHAHIYKEEAASMIEKNPFDFILGSLHITREGVNAHELPFDTCSDDELDRFYDGYLQEIYQIADTCDFDSLAHITYPLRYFSRSRRMNELCMSPATCKKEAFTAIFRRLIERGKALEVNTSGSEMLPTLPSEDVVKLFYDLGGRRITIGSDCHTHARLGDGIDKAESMLKRIGFEGVTVFIQRQPQLVSFSK